LSPRSMAANRSDIVSETADRDANRALRDRLSDVYGQYEQVRTQLDELPQRLASMQVTATSPDGLVQATVGPRGHLIDLRIDHEGYRRVDADDLAQTIVATVRSAAERTAGEVEALLRGFLPPDSGTLQLLRDNDFASLMGRADSIMRSPAASREGDRGDG
jgi:DNA-binding protein YbaB